MISFLLEYIAYLSTLAAQSGQGVLLWHMMPIELEMPDCLDEARDLLAQANEDSVMPIRLCFDLGHCSAHDVD